MNHCLQGGFVVGPDHLIPSDPSDYYAGHVLPVGCSRLVCQACHVTVRQAAGLDLKPAAERSILLKQHFGVAIKPMELGLYGSAYLPTLYDVADLATSPLVQASAGSRLYLCRCHTWTESSQRSLARDGDPDPSDPQVPWLCPGHPLVSLPHDFDGAIAKTPSELTELCQRALQGLLPSRAHAKEKEGAGWLVRLHDRVAGTDLQAACRRAVMNALDADGFDAAARARALLFFTTVDCPEARQHAFEILQKTPQRFVGLAAGLPSGEKQTLEDLLWPVLAPLVKTSTAVRDAARDEVRKPHRDRRALYGVLAQTDTAWLASQAEAIAGANPRHARDLAVQLAARAPAGFDKKPVVDRLHALAAQANSPQARRRS